MERKAPRPTIDDVARKAGVSIATVSRVLNKSTPVAIETTDRVLAAIDILNYQPQSAARILASQKTNTIGLLLPKLGSEFFYPMILGVESEAHANGYNLLINTARSGNDDQETQIPLGIGEHNTDGMILFANSLHENEIRRLAHLKFPLVLLHQSSPAGLNIPSVTFENKAGTRQIVNHLISVHGKKRIAILVGPENHEDSYWREIGYIEALEAHNLRLDPTLKFYGGFNAEKAKCSVIRLIKSGLSFDAIFAADDESASGAMMGLRECGLRIPEDIAVVGFDDTLLATHITPRLTTVHAPIKDAGHKAIQNLIYLINSMDAEPVTMLKTHLVIRQSCGCR